jgi:hypothetical protein
MADQMKGHDVDNLIKRAEYHLDHMHKKIHEKGDFYSSEAVATIGVGYALVAIAKLLYRKS